jgi:hypothetical protein
MRLDGCVLRACSRCRRRSKTQEGSGKDFCSIAASFNKQDSAGIAALFATGGLHVNPAGPRTDIAQYYEAAFKAGFDHEEVTVDQGWPLGSDTLLAVGKYRITGTNQSGAPIETGGIWTSTDVRESGKWKIRLISAMPKPPQPPK